MTFHLHNDAIQRGNMWDTRIETDNEEAIRCGAVTRFQFGQKAFDMDVVST